MLAEEEALYNIREDQPPVAGVGPPSNSIGAIAKSISASTTCTVYKLMSNGRTNRVAAAIGSTSFCRGSGGGFLEQHYPASHPVRACLDLSRDWSEISIGCQRLRLNGGRTAGSQAKTPIGGFAPNNPPARRVNGRDALQTASHQKAWESNLPTSGVRAKLCSIGHVTLALALASAKALHCAMRPSGLASRWFAGQ